MQLGVFGMYVFVCTWQHSLGDWESKVKICPTVCFFCDTM